MTRWREVAPHWGAWIEIPVESYPQCPVEVAPHWGAWIEIRHPGVNHACRSVAPHWGAWIEMCVFDGVDTAKLCRTPLGCVD